MYKPSSQVLRFLVQAYVTPYGQVAQYRHAICRCSVCVDMHSHALETAEETDERLLEGCIGQMMNLGGGTSVAEELDIADYAT